MSSQNRMMLPDGTIADQDQSQFLLGKACFAQRDIFRNRVVFTVAFRGRKGGKRRAPAIDFTELSIVADIANGRVDGAIGLFTSGAAGLCLDVVAEAQALRGVRQAAPPI